MKKLYTLLLVMLASLYGVSLSASVISSSASGGARFQTLNFAITEDGKGLMVMRNGSTYSGTVDIPAEVSDGNVTFPVTAIGFSAFSGSSDMTEVILPNSITSIGESAFYNCSGLTSLKLPAALAHIGQSAFEGCSGLTSVTMPEGLTAIGASAFSLCGLTSMVVPNSVTSIGDMAFMFNDALTEVVLPDNVTELGSNVFYGCSALKSVNIPAGITAIPYGFMAYCSALTTLSIPEAVTSIGGNAFMSCNGLTDVMLHDKVETIGFQAFNSCQDLRSVTLGSGIANIEDNAFHYCKNLQEVNVRAVVPPVMQNAFMPEQKSQCVLNVPIGSKAAYLADEAWSGFKEIVEKQELTGVVSVTASGNAVTVRMSDGGIVVSGGDGARVEVFSIGGATVYSTPVYSGEVIRLHTGAYVVKAGGCAVNVMVK